MGDDWLDGTTAIVEPWKLTGNIQPVAVPTLTILYHSDLTRIGDFLLLSELVSGRVTEISRTQPLFSCSGPGPDRPLADPFISRGPFSFSNAESKGIRLTVKPHGPRFLANGSLAGSECIFTDKQVAEGIVLELADRVVLLLHQKIPAAESHRRYGLIGESEAMVRVRSDIARVADLETTVLLRGETGTGKELVARAIHENGARQTGPFVGVNMGAIPASLAASELFGAERGAYTGANRAKKGLFQAAHGGTLFLDEVAETPPEIQVMLLRVLETKEVFPVGSQHPQKVDVRLLAATDADLEHMIGSGAFRAPLLHRLSGYQIWIAPLRERRDDFGRLLAYFLQVEAKSVGEQQRLAYRDPRAEPWLSAPLAGQLARYSWPGNVRQLQNVVRQLVIGSRAAEQIVPGPVIVRMLETAPEARLTPTPGRALKPSAIPEKVLLEAMRLNHWEVKASAVFLGISRTSLHARLEKCSSIRKARDISADELERCYAACDGRVAAMVDVLEVSKAALRRRLKEVRND